MQELNIGRDSTVALPPPKKNRTLTRVLVPFAVIGGFVVLCLLVVVVRFYRAHPYEDFRAFSTPSGSMCPTICEHDRLIAATDAYEKVGPRRGDLIIFKSQLSGALFTKRIIGVGGDTVSRSVDGAILVNGKRVELPPLCGKPRASPVATSSLRFERVTVPANSFFVVGDNLENSYDSRIEGFGFVASDSIRAKPLVLYWSPDRSRIGCDLR